jgi:hypothetical protein
MSLLTCRTSCRGPSECTSVLPTLDVLLRKGRAGWKVISSSAVGSAAHTNRSRGFLKETALQLTFLRQTRTTLRKPLCPLLRRLLVISVQSAYIKPWCNVLNEKLMLAQAVEKFAVFYGAPSRSQWPRGLRHELSSLAWMSVCVYSVFVFFCVYVEALQQADPPSKESYRLCI